MRIVDRHVVQRNIPEGHVGEVALRGIRAGLIPYDKVSLGQACHHRLEIADPLDLDHARGASLHGGRCDSVNVGMIPVKTWRLIGRNVEIELI